MLSGIPLFPEQASELASQVDSLYFFILAVTSFFALLVVMLVVIFVIAYAAIAGLFQAGLDLVFFDELMKTVPQEYSATFVSLVQSMQYLSAIVAPLVGTWLADSIGLGGALWVSAGLRLFGFLLFLRKDTPN
jgi:MFS family permease